MPVCINVGTMSDRELPPRRPRSTVLRRQRPSAAEYRRRRIIVGVIAFVVLFGGYKLGSFAWSFVSENLFAAGTPSTQPTDSEPTPTEVTPTPTSTNPEDFVSCAAGKIDVNVEIENGPTFSMTDELVINAFITYVGDKPCKRDVGARNNEIFIKNTEGSTIWSSDTCPVSEESALVVMNPGDKYRVTILWNGMKTGETCETTGNHAQPGDYQVFGRNGNSTSKPTAISFS